MLALALLLAPPVPSSADAGGDGPWGLPPAAVTVAVSGATAGAVDAGGLIRGRSYVLPVRVENRTGGPIPAFAAASGCGCMTATGPPRSVPPGGSGWVRLALTAPRLTARLRTSFEIVTPNETFAVPVRAAILPPVTTVTRTLLVPADGGEIDLVFRIAADGPADRAGPPVRVEAVGAPTGGGAVERADVRTVAGNAVTVRCRLRPADRVAAGVRRQRFVFRRGERPVGEVEVPVAVAGRLTVRPDPVQFRRAAVGGGSFARVLVEGLPATAAGHLRRTGAVVLASRGAGVNVTKTVALETDVRTLSGGRALLLTVRASTDAVAAATAGHEPALLLKIGPDAEPLRLAVYADPDVG